MGGEVKPSRIVGVFEAVSEPFRDSSRIFSSKGMKFITNKKKWSSHLMSKAMRKIPEKDFKKILSETN